MAKAKINIPSDKEIEKMAIDSILEYLNVILKKSVSSIQIKLKKIIKAALQNSPEYASIKYDELKAEFGIVDSERIDRIIDIWVNSFVVKVKPITFNKKIKGGFVIQAIKSNYADVLGYPESEIETNDGKTLPWLKWLLTLGDDVIIRDYYVSYGMPQRIKGRTKLAIMVRTKGARWSVPPQFSGTFENNFVTRTLDSLEENISKMIEDELSKQVK